MSFAVPTEHYLLLSAVLFCIGVAGVATKRNPIVVFMCIEIMLNAANLGFVALGRHFGDVGGQIYTMLIIAVAAGEVAIGLAIIVSLFRTRETIDLDEADLLKL
ncbi:MAG: NADH-quinone oxidoreductase subunit NuoK [Chthonomonadales bacterium]|nr:NADH-quinone oxidoreductase subunit NuoK [Chthonomonadales bacterium]